jgi:hypothetical protein
VGMDIGGAPLAPGMATESGDSGSTSPGTTIVIEIHSNFHGDPPIFVAASEAAAMHNFCHVTALWFHNFLFGLIFHGDPLHGLDALQGLVRHQM